jgi:hypothetical protein
VRFIIIKEKSLLAWKEGLPTSYKICVRSYWHVKFASWARFCDIFTLNQFSSQTCLSRNFKDIGYTLWYWHNCTITACLTSNSTWVFYLNKSIFNMNKAWPREESREPFFLSPIEAFFQSAFVVIYSKFDHGAYSKAFTPGSYWCLIIYKKIRTDS